MDQYPFSILLPAVNTKYNFFQNFDFIYFFLEKTTSSGFDSSFCIFEV